MESSALDHVSFQLERALVLTENGSQFPSRMRTSKTKYLWKKEINYFDEVLKRRIEAITGLNLRKFGVGIQMNNYGVGGHFASHTDTVYKRLAQWRVANNPKIIERGRVRYSPLTDTTYGRIVRKDTRLATWMYYVREMTEILIL